MHLTQGGYLLSYYPWDMGGNLISKDWDVDLVCQVWLARQILKDWNWDCDLVLGFYVCDPGCWDSTRLKDWDWDCDLVLGFYVCDRDPGCWDNPIKILGLGLRPGFGFLCLRSMLFGFGFGPRIMLMRTLELWGNILRWKSCVHKDSQTEFNIAGYTFGCWDPDKRPLSKVSLCVECRQHSRSQQENIKKDGDWVVKDQEQSQYNQSKCWR